MFYLPSVSCSRNHLLSAPLIVFSSSLCGASTVFKFWSWLRRSFSFFFCHCSPKAANDYLTKCWECMSILRTMGYLGRKFSFPKVSNICSFIRYHDESDWSPLLYPYQQTGANVLYFTFIDPATMLVPLSFRKLGNK